MSIHDMNIFPWNTWGFHVDDPQMIHNHWFFFILKSLKLWAPKSTLEDPGPLLKTGRSPGQFFESSVFSRKAMEKRRRQETPV